MEPPSSRPDLRVSIEKIYLLLALSGVNIIVLERLVSLSLGFGGMGVSG